MNNLNNMSNIPMGQRQQFGMPYSNQLAAGTQANTAQDTAWQANLSTELRQKLVNNL
jgi:hypothetical protein